MQIASIAAVAGGLCLALVSQAYGQSAPPDHLMVAPSELKWTSMPSLPCGTQLAVIEGPMNEAKPFIFRLKIPADCKIPPHWHPAIEHVTVISGTLNMGTGDVHDASKTTPMKTGSVTIMQPNIHHFGWASEETIVQIHGVGPWGITYVNPADDPTKKS
jgi:quercetin dioxygenase-like cupin family protein